MLEAIDTMLGFIFIYSVHLLLKCSVLTTHTNAPSRYREITHTPFVFFNIIDMVI